MDWLDAIVARLENISDVNEVENIRVEVFGKKGLLANEFASMKTLNSSEKKEVSKRLNSIKTLLENKIRFTKSKLLDVELDKKIRSHSIDHSLFDANISMKYGHPINITLDKIINYFIGANFSLRYGPLVESEFYSFEALNIPKFHPARDMQDTFYFNDGHLLRPHTSPVQIRSMELENIPIRIISPGAVFRRDYDTTHSPMFHQVEGLVVDSKGMVSFANLKYILEDFLSYIFGDVRVRFRTSFFPFTEPSAEVDISCVFCNGAGCKICSNTGWLEVLGCGMVDPNVFDIIGIKNVSGYAFGLGVERFAMLLHQVNDLRSFFETDLSLLEQF